MGPHGLTTRNLTWSGTCGASWVGCMQWEGEREKGGEGGVRRRGRGKEERAR